MDTTPVGTPRGGGAAAGGGAAWAPTSPSGGSEPNLGGVLSVLSALGVDGAAEPIDDDEPPSPWRADAAAGSSDGPRPAGTRRRGDGGGSGGGDGGGDAYPTPEVDSRERKLIRNRLAALKSRQAAKARRASAEADHSALVGRVRALLARNEGLRTTASGLRSRLAGEIGEAGGVVEELAAAYAACATAMELGLA